MFPNFMNNMRQHFDNVANDVAAQANQFRNNPNNLDAAAAAAANRLDAAATAAANRFGFAPPTQSTHHNHQQHQTVQGANTNNQRAPPASAKAIRQLPTIRVQPEDLQDPNNRECCVCLEDHHFDERVTRLPCAHIFHSHCILDWLTQHSCTCPVCRYELPTDDPQYEAGRIERMKARKPRFAMHELQRLSIAELLALKRRPIPSVGMEKKELIRLLVDHQWVDIIPAPKPVEYRIETLRKMKIRELKHCMEDAGVYFRPEDVVEKADMITIFRNSGRLIVIDPSPPSPTLDEATTATETSSTQSGGATSAVSSSLSTTQSDDDDVSTSSARRSVTGYPGHRPTVETVMEDDSDDDNVATDNTRHIRNAQVLFSQQEDEFPASPRSSLQQSESPTPDASSSSAQGAEIETATPDIQPPFSAAHSSMDEPSTDEPSTDEPMEEEEVDDASVADATNPTANDIAASSSTVNDATTAHPIGSRERPIDVDNELTPTNPVEQWDPRDTFHHYTISNLQDLAKDANIDISSCFERSEMVNLMLRAGIFGTDDPKALHPALFQSWSVSQLRVVASQAKIDLSSCHARHEMVETILAAANTDRLYLRDYLRSLSPLTQKSLSDLKSIARELRVDISDCLEKDEIIGRLISRSSSLGVC